MYCLVYFPSCRSSSVISYSAIKRSQNSNMDKSKQPQIHDIVDVFLNNSYITGKILRMSSNKNYLKTLNVRDDGEIISPRKKLKHECVTEKLVNDGKIAEKEEDKSNSNNFECFCCSIAGRAVNSVLASKNYLQTLNMGDDSKIISPRKILKHECVTEKLVNDEKIAEKEEEDKSNSNNFEGFCSSIADRAANSVLTSKSHLRTLNVEDDGRIISPRKKIKHECVTKDLANDEKTAEKEEEDESNSNNFECFCSSIAHRAANSVLASKNYIQTLNMGDDSKIISPRKILKHECVTEKLVNDKKIVEKEEEDKSNSNNFECFCSSIADRAANSVLTSKNYLRTLNVEDDGEIISSRKKLKYECVTEELANDEKLAEKEEEDKSNSNNFECFCSSIPVTPEVISAFEMVTSFLKDKYKKESRKKSSCSQQCTDQGNFWEIPGPGKIELAKGSEVWVESKLLFMISESMRNNPNQMVRELLIHLIGEETLAISSALGQGSKRAINPTVYAAVKRYVISHANGINESFNFNRVINQLCANRAVKFGLTTPKVQ